MIIPAEKKTRWWVWVMGYGVVLAVVLTFSIGVYIFRKPQTPSDRVLDLFVLKSALVNRPTPTPTPITPQKTNAFFRGTYLKLEKDILELKGTAGSIEKIQIGDRTDFTCTPRYIQDANGTAVDMTNVLVTVQSKGNYTARSSSASTFLSRLRFEGMVKLGDTVLVTPDTVPDNPTLRVSLMTDPCNPDKWKL